MSHAPAPSRTFVVAALGLALLLLALQAGGVAAAPAFAAADRSHSARAGATATAAAARRSVRRRVRIATARVRGTRTLTPGGFQVGVNAHPESDFEAIDRLGARVVRLEFDIGTPVEEMRPAVGALADSGARAVLLAGFQGRRPSVAQARSIASWAREFGPSGRFWADRDGAPMPVREIEFGNETSYSHQYGDSWDDPSYAARARLMGRRALVAALGLRGTGVGLLVQGEDGGTGSSVWMDSMLGAAPELAGLIAGWTVHPYGPRWKEKMDRLVSQSAAAGAPGDIPIVVTEWGVATDDGRCLSDNYGWDRCMSYDEAGTALRGSVAGMRERYGSRLQMVLLYQSYDQRRPRASRDREHFFGLLRGDARGGKDGLTAAAQQLMAG